VDIPILNVYYLLCYAWDKLAERDIVDVETLGSTSLVDLFARVLISGTNHLLKRGFDRGYVAQHESIGRIRGRICFTEAIRSQSTASGRLPCDFDELSYNVLHNQILKATFRRVGRLTNLNPQCSEGLLQLARRLAEVDDIPLNERAFGNVQLHRNNGFYDFLLKICQLILRNLLISEKTGAGKFTDFVRDPEQMAALFEEFVRNFYRIHTPYWVGRENISWRWQPVDQASRALLPKMQTDISLVSSTAKIVIDCKYTPRALQHKFGGSKLRSEHLYQINAYMDNLGPLFGGGASRLMLLYPTAGEAVRADYVAGERRISIRTLNLAQPWPAIHDDLLALLDDDE
jgi:5-methylcytosine-specific restriction enzyme subunit McrC